MQDFGTLCCTVPVVERWFHCLYQWKQKRGWKYSLNNKEQLGRASEFCGPATRRGDSKICCQEGCQELLGEGRNLPNGNSGYFQPWHFVFQFVFLNTTGSSCVLLLQQVAQMFFFPQDDKVTLC